MASHIVHDCNIDRRGGWKVMNTSGISEVTRVPLQRDSYFVWIAEFAEIGKG